MAMSRPGPRRISLLSAALAAVLAAFVFQGATADDAAAQGDMAIEISPTLVSPVMAVGDETREVITIRNSSTDEMLVSSRVQFADEEGPKVLKIEAQPQELTIPPGESAEVGLWIRVSPDAEVQARKATVLFLAEPLSERDVTIAGQVVVLVEANIIRPIDKASLSAPRFSDANGALLFTAEGRNNGNFPTRLESVVRITGPFSDDIVLSADSAELAVGETAVIELEWSNTPAFALRRVRHTLSSGIGVPVERTSVLVIVPWRLILMLCVIAAATAAGALLLPVFTNVFPPKGRKTK